MTDEKYLFFDQLPAFLAERTGLRLCKATLHKICSPGVATGPKPAAYWGRRPVFRPTDVLEWAQTKLSAVPTNISPKKETPPLKRRGKLKALSNAKDTISRKSAQ